MDIKDLYLIMKDPQGVNESKKKATEVINRPIPKELIKTREGAGKKMLSYIEGETVIRLINEAFGEEGWSFQIVGKYIIPSQPKQMTQYNSSTRKLEKLYNSDGTPKLEDQPPIAEVHGRLIVPGFGIREQFGTKALLGGYTEQEGASKAAATDALKKCATLFGIGLELYDDKPQQNSYKKNNNKQYKKQAYYSEPNEYLEEVYPPEEIKKLKEFKTILLETEDNDELNPYVEEFTGSKGDTWEKIIPSNIAEFNKFLEKKAINV